MKNRFLSWRRAPKNDLDPNDAEILKAMLSLKRGQLRKHLLRGQTNSKSKTSARRSAENKVRKLRKKYIKRPYFPDMPKHLLLKKFGKSTIADRLCPERENNWIIPHKRKEKADVDAVDVVDFSFIEHPEQTLKTLIRIAKTEASEVTASLNFLDPKCLDISAYMVLAEMTSTMLPIFRGGKMTVPLQKVIAATGLSQRLGMQMQGLRDFDDVYAFPIRRRHSTGSSKSETLHLDTPRRDEVADELCDEIDFWLNNLDVPLELTREFRGRFKDTIGEILDNAERHSNPPEEDGDWSVAAVMVRRPEFDPVVYRCYIGFLSVGASFSESLMTASKKTIQNIDNYCDDMESCNAVQSKDTLRTLCAIQDGVTRVVAAEERHNGGYGLQTVLESVSILGATGRSDHSPAVTILSGTSCIQLKNPYIFDYTKDQRSENRTMWFNTDNTQSAVPDSNHVFDIDDHFPGTLVSIAFNLDSDYLVSRLKNG